MRPAREKGPRPTALNPRVKVAPRWGALRTSRLAPRRLVVVLVPDAHRQLPSLGHGVPGVAGQIEQDLLDVSGLRLDQEAVGPQIALEVDVRPDEPADELLGVRHQGIEVDRFGLPAAAVGKGSRKRS